MDLQEKRHQIAAEIFAATGAKVDGYDPLIIAALFYSQHLNAAGNTVTLQLEAAAKEVRAASQVATAANSTLLADRARLLKEIEAHVARCVKQASKGQSNPYRLRDIPFWYAVAGAFAGAVALAAALAVGIERGSSLAEDAAVGRSFARVVPTMDPKLKQELMEHLRKNPG